MTYFNLNEIPLPEGARPDGNRVYVFQEAGGGERVKLYIGIYANKVDGTFYPNNAFRLSFPDLWAQHYGSEQLTPYYLELGMHLVTLLIGHRNGIYPILHKAFGPQNGNALMDFAVYSIKDRQNVAYLFQPAMSRSVLFSKDRFDDDFLTKLFNKELSREKINDFKLAWLQACKERGLSEVWLTVDGSNNNCEIDSPLAQEGKAKSGKHITIVSYIWAVSAKDGTPITYFLNEGGTVDAKALTEVTTYLTGNGIAVKGVILDRAFVSHEVLDDIAGKFEYVLKLKSDTYAHENMVNAYGQKIYWNINYLIGEDALFGITKGPWKLFEKYENKAYISLYFDGKNGSERKVTLYNKIYQAKQKAFAMAENGERPEIGSAMNQYLKIEKLGIHTTEQDEELKCRYLVLAAKGASDVIFKKGFDSIASSQNMKPEETNTVYHLRDASEKQFMVSKSMLGSDVFRSHTTEGIESRELAVFLAAILRCDLMNACKRIGFDLDRMIGELDAKLFLIQMGNGIYTLINKSGKKIQQLLKYYGCTDDDLQVLTGDVTERERNHGIGVSQFHDLPEDIRKRNDKRRKQATGKSQGEGKQKGKQESNDVPYSPRKPGRPKGSKNRKTIEREAAEATAGTAPVKRAPGRPRGRKNNSTLAREAAQAAMMTPEVGKRKRGRPAGSKDKQPRTRRTKAEMNRMREAQD